MFERQAIVSDSQLNNEQLANLLIAEALDQLTQLTQLSGPACEKLLKKQLSHANQMHANVIIEQEELEFIRQLFC